MNDKYFQTLSKDLPGDLDGRTVGELVGVPVVGFDVGDLVGDSCV